MIAIIGLAIAVIGSIVGGAIAAKTAQYAAERNRQLQLENYDFNRALGILQMAQDQQKQKILIENVLLISGVLMIVLVVVFKAS